VRTVSKEGCIPRKGSRRSLRFKRGGPRYSHVELLGVLDLSELLSLGHHVLVLDTHDSGGSLRPGLSIGGVLGSEVSLESREVLEVGGVDLGERDAGGGLGVDEGTEGGSVLDNAVGDALGSAESGEEGDKLDGLAIVGDSNELGLTLLDELSDVVKTVLEDNGLITNELVLVATLAGLGLGLESLLLLSSGLGLVSVEELEELVRLVLVEDLGEDVESGGHLESHHEDSLLSLDSDVLGPLDESGEVSSGLDVTTDTEASGGLLEESVGADSGLAGLLGDDGTLGGGRPHNSTQVSPA
jgi:hypothetical protein